MEMEVRSVAGLEGCYVSLPLHLIQTLQSTSSSASLFSFLALELRSLANNHDVWFAAWSGSASSSSSAIEIAQQFADCINLPDHTIVRVRAIPNLPKAISVMIEPDTEDDWEVLELNAEHAEAAILKQTGIVHEGMRFPLWLHGHTTVTFSVISTDPKEPMVQLVPGTEVSVAPKRRKKPENSVIKALLRIQDGDSRFFHKFQINNTEMGTVLTCAAFLNPKTANKFSLDSLESVILEQKLVIKERKLNHENNSPNKNRKSVAKEVENGNPSEKKDIKQAFVRILISDSVAEGHVMISQSLRYYLRADLHSWIHVKSCDIIQQKDAPSFVISPFQFNILGKKVSENNGFNGHKNRNRKELSDTQVDFTDWSNHEKFIAVVSDKSSGHHDEESINRKELSVLLRAWILAQLDAIKSFSTTELDSIILRSKTLLHFQVKTTAKHAKESLVNIMFVLSVSEDSMKGGLGYEIQGNIKSMNQRKLDEKVCLGEVLPPFSVKEIISEKRSNTDIASLSWMGTTAVDVTNSRIDGVIVTFFWNVLKYLQSSISWTCVNLWTSWFWKDVISHNCCKNY